MKTKSQIKISVQSARLSRSGGGIPSAVLPVVRSLNHHYEMFLCTFEAPEESVECDFVEIKRGFFDHRKISRRLQEFTPEIVHTHGLWSPFSRAALDLRKKIASKLVVSPHGMLDSWALKKSPIKKAIALGWFERKHLNHASVVHALNKEEASSIRRIGVRSAIAVVPNGVDLLVDKSPPKPAYMDKPCLLFLGRLTPKKGISELIQAFAMFTRKVPGWRLVLAGWEDESGNYRGEAAETGADVVFSGPVFGETKEALYSHADAFVLPSFSEGLPMAVLEAWSAGLPVFMTRECNLGMGFKEGAAVEISMGPESMAEVFSDYLPNKEWRKKAGRVGRQLVKKDYSWEVVAQSWQKIYDFLLGKGPKPSEIYV